MVQQSRILGLFSKYNQLLSDLTGNLKALKAHLGGLDDLDEFRPHDFKKKSGMFGTSGTDEEMAQIHDRLKLNRHHLVPIIDDFIKFIEEKEKPELLELFKSPSFETIDSIHQAEQRLIGYNRGHEEFIRELRGLVPGLLNTMNLGLTRKEIKENESAKNFVSFYKDFEEFLVEKGDKARIFDAMVAAVQHLIRYFGDMRVLDRENEETYIRNIGQVSGDLESYKGNAIEFVHNLFRGFTGRTVYLRIEKLLSKIDGEDDEVKKSYVNFKPDEDMNKVDKEIKSILEDLVSGIKVGDVELKKQVGEIFKVSSDIGEWKKLWFEDYRDRLNNKVLGVKGGYLEITPGSVSGFAGLKFVKSDGNTITIKDFEEFFEDANLNEVKYLMGYIKSLLGSGSGNKKMFNEFLSLNSDLFKEEEGGSDEDLDTEIDSTYMRKIETVFSNLFANRENSSEFERYWAEIYDLLFGSIENKDGSFESDVFVAIIKFKKNDISNFTSEIQQILQTASSLRNSNDASQILQFLGQVLGFLGMPNHLNDHAF